MQNLVVLLLPKEKKRTVLVEEEVKKITSGEWVGGRAPERAGRRAMHAGADAALTPGLCCAGPALPALPRP
jgi:hypothetical protein